MQKGSSVSRVQSEEDSLAAARQGGKGLLPPAVVSLLPFLISLYLSVRGFYAFTSIRNLAIIAPSSLVLAGVGSLLWTLAQTLGGAVGRVLQVHVFRNELYANLPRPSSGGSRWPGRLLWGDFDAIRKAEPAQAHIQWAKELGSYVYIYRGIFYSPRLLLGDPTAMLHILSSSNCYSFPKPLETRKFLADLLGLGLVTVEGDVHKKHRKITAPAFSVSAVKSYVPVFWRNANGLVEGLLEQCEKTEGAKEEPFVPLQTKEAAKESRPGQPVLDVSAWLGRCTLDIIGQVGFGYQFNAVSDCVAGQPGGLSEKVDRLLGGMTQLRLVDFLRLYLQSRPGFKWMENWIPPSERRRRIAELGETFASVGSSIVSQKKEEILLELKETGASLEKANLDAALEASSTAAGGNRDLLHRVIMASLAEDVPAKDRLDDDELVGEMMSFLLAGHETTATLTQWALWRLSSRPDIVSKLRAEIAEHRSEDEDGKMVIEHDVLNTEMPYLDSITRETLRLHAPVTSTARVATEDCVIPLGKAYPARKPGGPAVTSIPLKAGMEIMIPIQVINSSTDLWGPTAADFEPDRWTSVPVAAKESGLPLQLMTFISGGRSCVGSRMAQLEFKVLLCALIDKLDFERVEGWSITARQGVVTRGVVDGQEGVGTQMPLRIRRRERGGEKVAGAVTEETAATATATTA